MPEAFVRIPDSEIVWEDYKDFVAEEFKKGNISIREGAKMLDIAYEAFCEFVSERNIPIDEQLTPEQQAEEDALLDKFLNTKK